jgi:glycogen debranching enzyme
MYCGPLYEKESILEEKYIPALVMRLLSRDLFVARAGIRTLSSRSLHFDPASYHNGSIWPHDTEMLAEGLENVGYKDEAKRVRMALKRAYQYFKTPIELFVFAKGKYGEYQNPAGHGACKVQAWSAASLLAAFALDENIDNINTAL